MASAFVALANITLSSAQSSVTFSNISGDYRDLRMVNFVSSANGNQDIGVEFNGTTGTSYTYMAGFGSSTGSGFVSNLLGYVSSAGILHQIDLFDYSQTNKQKSGLVRYGGPSNFSASAAVRWANTAAITSIRFYLGTGTFAAGSSFTLYGVAA